ncbi:MAG: hypothetical protein N2544_12870 [Burkholderiales bacterium]|nr:hypothetical protein [Burkholderiales bacterium]
MTLRLVAGPLERFFAEAPDTPGPAGFDAWRGAVDRALAARGLAALARGAGADAPETGEALGWGAYGALVMWAAYADQPARTRPLMEPDEWHKDPAVLACAAPGFASHFPTLVRGVELWLPGGFDAVLEIPAPGGDVLDAGSTGELARELEDLNAATWAATGAEIRGWTDTVDAQSPRVDDLARRGLAAFVRAAARARAGAIAVWLEY